jgi:hypothetical protein
VIVWLGPAADGSDEVMETWYQICKMAYDVGFIDFFDNSRRDEDEVLWCMIIHADPQDPGTNEFQRVLDRVTNMMNESTLKSWTALEEGHGSPVYGYAISLLKL